MEQEKGLNMKMKEKKTFSGQKQTYILASGQVIYNRTWNFQYGLILLKCPFFLRSGNTAYNSRLEK